MNAYDLPTSLLVGEVAYQINYGWRTALKIFRELNNPDYSDAVKLSAMVRFLYPQWQEIPQEHIMEAVIKAQEFLDCGMKPEEHKRPKIMDWEQDADIIIPAVNNVSGCEVRSDPNIHWWTFFSWYMSIEKSLFSSVLNIRQKKAKGKKLEKYEEEFYLENKTLIDLKKEESEEIRKEKENIMKWL